MRERRTLIAASLVAIAVAASPAAHAQLEGPSAPLPPGPQPAATDKRALAEMLFFTARGLMEADRYSEACDKLAESYRLDPAAGTLLNMAVCHQKVGKVASAWGEYRQALADARRMNRPDREQLAEKAIAALQPDLPFLTITVPAAVARTPGLVISQNGVPLMSGAWNTELPVDPGRVEIVEKAPGYKPKTLYVTIASREHKTMSVEPLELKPIVRPPPPYWTAKRTWGAVLLGVGVVAAGVGSYTGLLAIDNKNKSDSNCPTVQGALRCTQSGVDYSSRAQTMAWISDATLGAAVLGIGFGTYMMLTGGDKERPATPAAPPTATGIRDVHFGVGPMPGGASGVVTGSF